MQLDVPFIPDRAYTRFLQTLTGQLVAVHFSLGLAPAHDSRNVLQQPPIDGLNEQLDLLSGPRKYALLNSRFYNPRTYASAESLTAVLAVLEELLAAGNLHGVVFADHYLLQALSRASPAIAAELEAVPSVNAMLDSFDKINAHLELIATTCFRPPGKLVLDRSLNRDLLRLKEISSRCRATYPEIGLSLLANEGCLFQCPFKPAHDAHIALANCSAQPSALLLNANLGCIDYLAAHPGQLFKSPFIRPEDTSYYEEYVDTIKLCGRTLGSTFLRRAVAAYADKRYEGNLLDLFDTLDWLAARLSVPNHRIPSDFLAVVAACTKKCADCGYCEELYQSISRPRPLALADLRALPTR